VASWRCLAVLFAIADRVAEKAARLEDARSDHRGLASGLVLHPHFPHNLVVWWYQNVLFFVYRAASTSARRSTLRH
jgi:hypothetical protein